MTKATKGKSAKAAKGSKTQSTKATKAKATSVTKEVVKEVVKEATKAKAAPAKTKAAPAKTKASPESKPVAGTKRVVDKNSILTDFDTILSQLDENVNVIRENKTKSAINIKDIRGIQKQLRQLRSDVNRQIRNKRKLSTEQIASSGFMKPVNVSSDMCKFASWKSGEMHSRVEVTKFICNYIKQKDLQNPEDRRQIKADDKLSKLLKLDKNSSEPLTYYSLQRHIQQHFVSA